jgi:hypothetical protein
VTSRGFGCVGHVTGEGFLAPDIFTAVDGKTELQIRPRDFPHNFQLFINNAIEILG